MLQLNQAATFAFVVWLAVAFSGCQIETPFHPCDDCRPCETCVQRDDNAGAVCQPLSHHALRCDNGDPTWFNSCEEREEIATQCNRNMVCEDIAGGAQCSCRNMWSGAQCDACPVGGDTASDCAVCLPGFDTASGCTSCLGNLDILSACKTCKHRWSGANCDVCPEGFDVLTDCSACLNQWRGDDCNSCPENFSVESNCSDCANQWTGDACDVCPDVYDDETGCRACAGGNWTGDNCDVCPANYDMESGCIACANNWEGESCNFCPPQFTVESNCSECTGHFSGADCNICPLNFTVESNCVECANHWSGDNCDVCPGNWSAAADCAVCRNQWQGDDCDVCPGNWDSAMDCAVCRGNWDIALECASCLNHWVDNGDDCATCPGNWDAATECTACKGNFDPAEDCSVCKNAWQNDNNDCATCPGNWDSASDCASCVGNWDEANDCTICSNMWEDNVDNCGTCPELWDVSDDCATCVGNRDAQTACTTCLPGWHGDSCDVCRFHVDAESVALSPDGTSWTTAFSDLAKGLTAAGDAAAASGSICDVWVAEGTYTPFVSAPSDTFELMDGVRMYGDFDGDEEQLRQRSLSTNETVLDGQRDVWHVITASGNAYLDGFVITGGDGLTAGGSANGGGIYHSGERLTVYNTRLYSNYAVNGGAIAANSDTLVISNAAMYRNYGQSKGHAIYVGSGAMAYITNCTLAYNDVSQKGLGDGTIYSDNASGEILNTIIWGNSDGELEGDQFDLDWTILYSIVENELQMNEDPLLTSDRYHLTWQSPCVDWGSDRGMYTLNHDMEGHIWSEVNVERMSAVDIGAVDYNPAY